MIGLDWTNPAAVAAWATSLRATVDDALAAGLDATDAPGRRMLGRRAAREQLLNAKRSIDADFTFAGLDGPKAGA
jgi:hypothetical protein